VVTADGYVRPVVLEPKLRACLQQTGIKHILTPNQRDARPGVIAGLIEAMMPTGLKTQPDIPPPAQMRLGFAAENRRLVSHRCRHVAEALLALGGLTSGWQKSVTHSQGR
jgi:hypothetical protein